MFKNLKNNIKDLAYSAVSMVEESLFSSSGAEKKTAAISYVVSMLPIPPIFKGITSIVLSKVIDEAIENAVSYMKSIQNTEA